MVSITEKKEILKQYSLPFDPKSGMPLDEVRSECEKILANGGKKSRRVIKTELICFVLRHSRLQVSPACRFADAIEHANIIRGDVRRAWMRGCEEGELREVFAKNANAEDTLCYIAEADFGHVAPDWERVLSLGIPGMRRELVKSRREDRAEFYDCSIAVLDAFSDYALRLSDTAIRAGGPYAKETAATLRALTERAPATLAEAMQLIFLVYRVQEYVEGEFCRSVSRLDQTLYPFLGKGGCNEELTRQLIDHFLLKFCAVGNINNTPFTLAGLGRDGKDKTNEMTYLILDEYIALDIQDPKIHIRCNSQTPKELLQKVLSSIRDGKNSFVFLNDDLVIPALCGIGEDIKDARDYLLIGCYEPAAAGKEIPCTCNGRLSVEKTVEAAMTNGRDLMTGKKVGPETGEDFDSFDDFYAAVKEQLRYFAECSMEKISLTEREYMKMNPSPFLSATFEECVRDGRDVYEGGAKYNNSSIVIFAMADAVDSLTVIKKLVYEEKRVTLHELREILKNNWEGNESLRLQCIRDYPKYGNGDPTPDAFAKDLAKFASDIISGRPNGRGGVFRFGMFSVDWRMAYGERAAAGANGRKAGTPLSKNMCASVGLDKNGVSAMMKSAAGVGYDAVSDGTVLDVMLHPTMVSGEDGLNAFVAMLETYFAMGGMGVQFNVLDVDCLRRAQEHPEEYQNLQVRLCGWNVYFVNLSREEQDEFILQCSKLTA